MSNRVGHLSKMVMLNIRPSIYNSSNSTHSYSLKKRRKFKTISLKPIVLFFLSSFNFQINVIIVSIIHNRSHEYFLLIEEPQPSIITNHQFEPNKFISLRQS